jgi:hypothetical protein
MAAAAQGQGTNPSWRVPLGIQSNRCHPFHRAARPGIFRNCFNFWPVTLVLVSALWRVGIQSTGGARPDVTEGRRGTNVTRTCSSVTRHPASSRLSEEIRAALRSGGAEPREMRVAYRATETILGLATRSVERQRSVVACRID